MVHNLKLINLLTLIRKDLQEGLDILTKLDQNLMRALELAIQFDKWVLVENVGLSLKPILLEQIIQYQIGEERFRFFMATTHPNHYYSPETSVKVTIINFAIPPLELEEQIENLNLENKKIEPVRKNAQDKKESNEVYLKQEQYFRNIDGLDYDQQIIKFKKFAAKISQHVKEFKNN